MDKQDIVVIGAGVVGLAVASELSGEGKSIIVLEKNKAFGLETSSRNSEVIHGGMYYPSGTLKATMCVEGREILYDICGKNNIPNKKIGKLIVATCQDEVSSLDKILKQGMDNGVKGLKMLGQKQLKMLEPNVSGVAALLSEETGIIDSHRLMQYFYDRAKDNGALIAFNSEVVNVEKVCGGYRVTVYNDGEITELKAIVTINCSGLDSDIIAERAGIDIKKSRQVLYYCKGQYFRVKSSKSNLINRLIYPVPKPKSGGLGIHATLDLAGSLRLGPDDEYLKDRSKDYSVDPAKRNNFYNSARSFLPFIDEDDLLEDTSGLRPKLQEPGGEFRDFVIQDESCNGLPAFINLVGIESPGLTASPAIARYVKGLVERNN